MAKSSKKPHRSKKREETTDSDSNSSSSSGSSSSDDSDSSDSDSSESQKNSTRDKKSKISKSKKIQDQKSKNRKDSNNPDHDNDGDVIMDKTQSQQANLDSKKDSNELEKKKRKLYREAEKKMEKERKKKQKEERKKFRAEIRQRREKERLERKKIEEENLNNERQLLIDKNYLDVENIKRLIKQLLMLTEEYLSQGYVKYSEKLLDKVFNDIKRLFKEVIDQFEDESENNSSEQQQNTKDSRLSQGFFDVPGVKGNTTGKPRFNFLDRVKHKKNNGSSNDHQLQYPNRLTVGVNIDAIPSEKKRKKLRHLFQALRMQKDEDTNQWRKCQEMRSVEIWRVFLKGVCEQEKEEISSEWKEKRKKQKEMEKNQNQIQQQQQALIADNASAPDSAIMAPVTKNGEAFDRSVVPDFLQGLFGADDGRPKSGPQQPPSSTITPSQSELQAELQIQHAFDSQPSLMKQVRDGTITSDQIKKAREQIRDKAENEESLWGKNQASQKTVMDRIAGLQNRGLGLDKPGDAEPQEDDDFMAGPSSKKRGGGTRADELDLAMSRKLNGGVDQSEGPTVFTTEDPMANSDFNTEGGPSTKRFRRMFDPEKDLSGPVRGIDKDKFEKGLDKGPNILKSQFARGGYHT